MTNVPNCVDGKTILRREVEYTALEDWNPRLRKWVVLEWPYKLVYHFTDGTQETIQASRMDNGPFHHDTAVLEIETNSSASAAVTESAGTDELCAAKARIAELESILREFDEMLKFNEKWGNNLAIVPTDREQLQKWRALLSRANVALGRAPIVYDNKE